MRKIDWFLVIVPLLFTWGIDRITKIWAMGLTGVEFFGPIGFVLHHNHGAMLGLFSETTPVIRVVSLSTGGAFLVFFFGIIQYLLPIKSLMLRCGLSMLLGGILGNVVDRIIYGYVIDFLLIGSISRSSPAFNLADALQWVGYGMIAFALLRDSEVLWPANDSRKKIWVNARFQLRYCFLLMGAGAGFATIAGVYSYTFLRVTIIDFGGHNPRILETYLGPFILSFLAVSFIFLGILFLVGRLLSARIAGPLYAFEKFLDDLAVGKQRPLRLRAGDEFRHLERLAARLSLQISQMEKSQEGLETSANAQPSSESAGGSSDESAGGSSDEPSEDSSSDASLAHPAITGAKTGTNG